MKQGITISPHNVGATRRCNFAAKPRLRPLRPQDQASVHVTCTMSRLQRIARDPREPPAQCAGAYLRWTVGAARSASPTASCRRGRRSRSAKQSKRNPLIDAAMPYIAHKNFATKNDESASLSPSSHSALQDRKRAKGGAITRIKTDRGLSQNAKRCWRS